MSREGPAPDPEHYPLCSWTPDGKIVTQDGDEVHLTELIVAYNNLVIEVFGPGLETVLAGQEFRGLKKVTPPGRS